MKSLIAIVFLAYLPAALFADEPSDSLWVTEQGGEATRSGGVITAILFAGSRINDEGLKRLAPFKDLRKLDLEGSEVTGAGLKHLASLTKLQELNLSRTRTGDEGLKHLRHLKDLQTLDLWNANVSD